MTRDELLKQKKERDEALKALSLKHKEPAIMKYDFSNGQGSDYGSVEYNPTDDTLKIFAKGSAVIEGGMIASLRDALSSILGD